MERQGLSVPPRAGTICGMTSGFPKMGVDTINFLTRIRRIRVPIFSSARSLSVSGTRIFCFGSRNIKPVETRAEFFSPRAKAGLTTPCSPLPRGLPSFRLSRRFPQGSAICNIKFCPTDSHRANARCHRGVFRYFNSKIFRNFSPRLLLLIQLKRGRQTYNSSDRQIHLPSAGRHSHVCP